MPSKPLTTRTHQVGGTHYDSGAFPEHWDIVVLMNIPYLKATALKYLWRWQKKNGIQDLKKAITYLEKMEYHMRAGLEDTTIDNFAIPLFFPALSRYMQWDLETSKVIEELIPSCETWRVLTAIKAVKSLIDREESRPQPTPSQEERSICTDALLGSGDQPTAQHLHPS